MLICNKDQYKNALLQKMRMEKKNSEIWASKKDFRNKQARCIVVQQIISRKAESTLKQKSPDTKKNRRGMADEKS